MGYAYMQRRICWPAPDATCLEGGCMWCNDQPFRSFGEIRRYVEKSGLLPNRGLGQKLAIVAWLDGVAHNFHGKADVRNTHPERET